MGSFNGREMDGGKVGFGRRKNEERIITSLIRMEPTFANFDNDPCSLRVSSTHQQSADPFSSIN
jgi:hypothetical protein